MVPPTPSPSRPRTPPAASAPSRGNRRQSGLRRRHVRIGAPAAASSPTRGSAGEYVDVTNTSGARSPTRRLRVLGPRLRQRRLHRQPTPTSSRPDQTLARGETLRVHFGTTVTQPSPPAVTTTWDGRQRRSSSSDGRLRRTGQPEPGRRSRASPAPGGTCRGTQQTSISTPPVGVTARTTAVRRHCLLGRARSRGAARRSPGTPRPRTTPRSAATPIASCTAGGAERHLLLPRWASAPSTTSRSSPATPSGTSGPSWRVLAAPRTVPSAPGSVAVSGTPGGVNVTWTPAAENGATITKYTASAYTAGTGGNPVGTCTTSNGSLTGCTIMKLQGGTQYFIDVVATNRAGNGAPSSPRTPGTPGPGGAVSTYSKGKVTVRWDRPDARLQHHHGVHREALHEVLRRDQGRRVLRSGGQDQLHDQEDEEAQQVLHRPHDAVRSRHLHGQAADRHRAGQEGLGARR